MNFTRHKYIESPDWTSIPDPVASIKYDGAHFFMAFDKQGKPSFISRRMGVSGVFPDRTNKLPHLADIHLPSLSGNVYSVELIHTGTDPLAKESHPAVSGILNSLPDLAKKTQEETGPIRAVLLDVKSPNINTFADKIDHLNKVSGMINKPDLIYLPKFITHIPDIHKLVRTTKEEGREGIIVTSLSKPELNNPRTKIKHYDTYNLKVSKVIQEVDKNGNLKNSAGALEVVDGINKVVCNVGTGFTKEQREEIWRDRQGWLGKLIQVKARKPSASKLISPVYNGLADGNIDTI